MLSLEIILNTRRGYSCYALLIQNILQRNLLDESSKAQNLVNKKKMDCIRTILILFVIAILTPDHKSLLFMH